MNKVVVFLLAILFLGCCSKEQSKTVTREKEIRDSINQFRIDSLNKEYFRKLEKSNRIKPGDSIDL